MASLLNADQTCKPNLPYVVDDNFELLHDELLVGGRRIKQEEGLSADSIGPQHLYSMSEYIKPLYANVRDLTNSGSMEDPLYLAYAPASSTTSSLPNPPQNYSRDQAVYGAGGLFSTRSVQVPAAPYASLRTRSIPQITEYHPRQGSEGTEIFINLTSAYELDNSWAFHAHFGDQQYGETVVGCAISRLDNQDGFYQYMLSTYAPSPPSSSWDRRDVPLAVRVRDANGNSIGESRAGIFRYLEVISHSPHGSPRVSRKRKLSNEALVSTSQPRRSVYQQDRSHTQARYAPTTYHYNESPTYVHASVLGDETSSASGLPTYPNHTDIGLHHQEESPNQATQILSHQHISEARQPSPQTPIWHNSAVPPPLSRSPNASAASSREHDSPVAGEPRLIRTSELRDSTSPSTPNGMQTVGAFNPYTIGKATLKIKGDMGDMANIENWSAEERETQRRLVHFYRSQSGSTITATFKPVAPEKRQPKDICISCIWWEAKQECYVTSVDTIALLEHIVGVKFTVEEKNRIRRNLEGFRPVTVSKGKEESEDFFKLIMHFPNPKPRNIEKDVKAFPWKTLDHALKKIISKYSASYSSTASIIPTTTATNYKVGYHQEMGHEALHEASPYGLPGNAVSTYGHVLPMPTHTSQSNSHLPLAYSSNVSPAIPTSAHTEDFPLYQYPTSQLGSVGLIPMMAAPPHPQQSHSSQQPRSSWDFGPYLDAPVSSVSDQTLYAMPAGQQHGQYSMTHASSGR